MKKEAFFTRNRRIMAGVITLFIIFYSVMGLFGNSYAATNYTQTVKSGISAFPESYQVYLRQIQEQHPNWTFDAYYTGIEWNDLVARETDHGHNRVHQNSDSLWKCSCGNIASKYACASEGIIKYYMDPRNFIDNDKEMFQFLETSYNSNYSKTALQGILNSTFMRENVTYGGVTKSYADIIMDAASASQVSPYALAIKIIQEVGVNGSGSVNGSAFVGLDGNTYRGYYNFFNLGSYDTGDAVRNGLIYAKEQGWDTPYKSIVEGAKIYGKNYTAKGQNTNYFTKWDVVGDTILKPGQSKNISGSLMFSHQYMTNIQDPTSQCSRLYNTYLNNGILDQKLNFVIPVYNNMPLTNKMPSTLTTKDGDLYYTTGTDILVRSIPGGTKIGSIPARDTVVAVLERKTAISNELEWDKVKLANGTVGYVASKYLAPCGTGKKAIISGSNVKAIPNITVTQIVSELKITNYEVTKNGTKIDNSAPVGTGYKLINKANNQTYDLVVMGDVDGNAKVLATDALKVLKTSTGASNLQGVYNKAADTNGDGKILANDALKILKTSTGADNISI